MDLSKVIQLPEWLCELTRHERISYLCPALQWHADYAMRQVMASLRAGREAQIGEARLRTPRPVEILEITREPIRRGYSVER